MCSHLTTTYNHIITTPAAAAAVATPTNTITWLFLPSPPVLQLVTGLTEIQESPAVADKSARRLRKVCTTIYVRAVGL